MVLNYKKQILIFSFFLAFLCFGQERKISFFYEREGNSEEECSMVMYLLNCIESEKIIQGCSFLFDSDFTSVTLLKRNALNKNEAFYIVHFRNKRLLLDAYNRKGMCFSSSNFDLKSCKKLSDLNLLKEEIFSQIVADIALLKEDEITPVISFYNKNDFSIEKKKLHDFPYIGLSASGVSFHLYYEDLPNFSFFPIQFYLSWYPFRYFELSFFYRLSYKDFYLTYEQSDGTIGKLLVPFAQFYGVTAGLSFFYEQSHYSFGISFYNISAFVERKEYFEHISSYFLPQFSFYQKLDVKLYKKIYYTIYIDFHTTQKFSKQDNDHWSGMIFNYDLPQVDVSLLGISVFF